VTNELLNWQHQAIIKKAAWISQAAFFPPNALPARLRFFGNRCFLFLS
jgi:hypothetical protein